MTFKEGVTKANTQPPIYYAIGAAEVIYTSFGHRLVVTALTDGHEDRPLSLHNKGLAVDLRTRDIPADGLGPVFGSLTNLLNPLGFDVVLEKDHIHIEYDPKGGETWLRMDQA